MVTMATTDGGTVTVTRCGGALVDIHVRDSSGRTVATVTRRVRPEENELTDLLANFPMTESSCRMTMN